jgi:hypothetical protein
MANTTNAVNVSLLLSGQLALADNPNVVVIMTSQQGPLTSASRYRIYSDAPSVATDCGSNSEAYSYALTFFGTSPNAVNASGFLVIGYWRAAEETVAATAALLTGAQLSLATVLGQLQTVSDGDFDITIDSTEENITGLDFTTSTTLAEIAAVIDTELTGGTCSVNSAGDRILITSDTTGASSTITFATDPADTDYVGSALGFTTG